MDQKNTIVKCKAHPYCLFNHNGICDNYVINIGADGKCEGYIQTANSEEEIIYENAKKMLKEAGVTLVEPKGEVKRDQRTKCNVYDDACDLIFCKPNCIFCTFKQDSYYCTLKKSVIDGFGFRCSKYEEEK
jgi:hypothetical protein